MVFNKTLKNTGLSLLALGTLASAGNAFAATSPANFGTDSRATVVGACNPKYGTSTITSAPFGEKIGRISNHKEVPKCDSDGTVQDDAFTKDLQSKSKITKDKMEKFPQLKDAGDKLGNGCYSMDWYDYNKGLIGKGVSDDLIPEFSFVVCSANGILVPSNLDRATKLYNEHIRDTNVKDNGDFGSSRAWYNYSKITLESPEMTGNYVDGIFEGDLPVDSEFNNSKKAEYTGIGKFFDVNSDGYVDRLNASTDGLTTKIAYGSPSVATPADYNDSDIIATEAVRKQIFRAIKYDKHGQEFDDDEIVRLSESTATKNFYVPRLTGEGMTIGDQAEDVLSYVIGTNKTATETKLKNAVGLAALVEKISRSKIKGEYKYSQFLENEDGSYRAFHDENSDDREDTYRDTFGEATDVLGYASHIFGSSVIQMIQHDYNPSRSVNKKLFSALGANFNNSIDILNGAKDYDDLENISKKLLGRQNDFYKGHLNATATKFGGLKQW